MLLPRTSPAGVVRIARSHGRCWRGTALRFRPWRGHPENHPMGSPSPTSIRDDIHGPLLETPGGFDTGEFPVRYCHRRHKNHPHHHHHRDEAIPADQGMGILSGAQAGSSLCIQELARQSRTIRLTEEFQLRRNAKIRDFKFFALSAFSRGQISS